MRIAFSTGAGISVPSGIRPYRGTGGIYTENPELEQSLTAANWHTSPSKVLAACDKMRDAIDLCVPNAAHHAIARLQDYHDVTVITQNVDDLHNEAGSRNVIELHGNLWQYVCSECGNWADKDQIIESGVLPKYCEFCPDEDFALMRPNVVLFGENLTPGSMADALLAIESADVIVSVGTSASVQPASFLLDLANERAYMGECKFYHLSLDRPEANLWKAVFVQGSAEITVPALCEKLEKLK